jgi:subtilisin family serine protease
MLINAYNYVTLMKNRGINVRVTNNSYGGCPETCGDDPALLGALEAMGDASILNVFAAGNSGTNNDITPFFPASYDSPHIVSVGGSGQSDEPRFNYGAITVDLAAPGIQIWSTIPMYNPNHYAFLNGTSMSAPHVAGAAALLAAQYPSLSAPSIKATLINTADALPAFTGLNRANGRLNVATALNDPTICTFSLASNSLKPPTKGGVFTVSVSAGQNCDFAAKSNVNWLQILDSKAFTGNSTVTFRVTLNPVVSRTGSINIAGQEFTVTQSRR